MFKRALLFTILGFIILSSFWLASVNAYYDLGKPSGFINDYAKIFTAEQKQLLENKISQFEKNSSSEIIVVTLPSLQDDTIENFAETLFKNWGIGKKKLDNGVLILIALQDRQMRIEVGYGLEGSLTDAQSKWMINNIMRPEFRKNNYYQGINMVVDKIISATQGEHIPLDSSNNSRRVTKSSYGNLFYFLSIIIFVIIDVLAIKLGKTKSYWLGGALGGVTGLIIGWLLFNTLLLTLLSIGIIGIFGLLFDYFVSKHYRKGKSDGHGGFFSGGGFGGFGGGMSGGGGSSGRW